ncbi:putative formaldehyde dehydrogenase AdhA, partial [Tetrabaena socialis]
VVGKVLAVGTAVPGLRPGDRAGVGWISNSCRTCLACLRGEENVCVKGYTGLIVNGNHGGFQQICRAPADFVYTIPDALDSAAAAPLLCAGITVYSPLRHHMGRPGARVAVLGIGGLGHLALQFANHMGGDVTALDIAADKEEEARKLGAHSFSTWGNATAAAELQGSFDLILNCASANINTGQLMSLLRNNGTLVQ